MQRQSAICIGNIGSGALVQQQPHAVGVAVQRCQVDGRVTVSTLYRQGQPAGSRSGLTNTTVGKACTTINHSRRFDLRLSWQVVVTVIREMQQASCQQDAYPCVK